MRRHTRLRIPPRVAAVGGASADAESTAATTQPELMKPLKTAQDITPDPSNANQGTARGAEMLKESLDACGLGRSILVDKHGVVIAGSHVLREAQARGVPIDVVESNGQELIVVQRTDLDLITDRKARQLAYYDNRVSEVDLSWSAEQIQADLSAGINVGAAFFPEELEAFVPVLPDPSAPEPSKDGPSSHLSDPTEAFPDPSAATTTPDPDPDPEADPSDPAKTTVRLSFDGLEPHRRWGTLMRILREQYPDAPTPGARLLAHLAATEGL